VHRSDDKISFGTGFRYSFTSDGLQFHLIVTAGHNLEKAVAVSIKLHRCDQLPNFQGQLRKESFDITFEELDRHCVFHPDASVDLVALNYLYVFDAAQQQRVGLFVPNADESSILDDQTMGKSMSAVEDVLMPGYPLAIFDEANNFPIIRKGTTATHPAIDFNDRPMAAVDIACFPGSSGSPIFLLNEGGLDSRKQGRNKLGRKSPVLLGILTDGAVFQSSGISKVSKMPIMTQSDNETVAPINLGYYTKAKAIKILSEAAAKTFEGRPPM
jgi:hypothetical protein